MGISLNMDGVKARVSKERLTKAQKLGAEQAEMLMSEKYVPKSKGNKQVHLRATSNVTQDGRIQYTAAYSKAQFYGTNGKAVFSNYSTPGTGKRWDLRLKGNAQDMADVKRAAAKGVI